MVSVLERLVGGGDRSESVLGSSEIYFIPLNERFENCTSQTMERYHMQLSAMDGMVAQMNQASTYLNQQLAVLGQANQR
ncbi:hypothetical protein [Vreelandella nanhaiensis]|uniref:Uncharacterized protein n=1 Tax=Vreelandella nanhaiensis TaxID=1258546 RepID=A0A433KTQ5_9GAMM|nr:hypothetical protein [Halomonas nanhaiensis]RUR33026.1 hypothetical protein ELY38_05600 [Halomonas nanhaiensis]